MPSLKDTILALLPDAYFRCDDASGSVLTDISGHSRNGTIVSPFTLGAKGGLVGDKDKAMMAPGGSSLAAVPTIDVSTGYSVVLWWRMAPPGDASTSVVLIQKPTTAPSNGSYGPFAIITTPASDVITLVNGAAGGLTELTIPFAGLWGQWHMVGMTYDGTTITGYVDGVNSGTATNNPGIDDEGKQIEIAGASGFSPGGLVGSIDEVAVWGNGVVLTDDNMAAIYAAGAPSSLYAAEVLTHAPITYFRCNEAIFAAGPSPNQLAVDSSGFAQNGSYSLDAVLCQDGALVGDSDLAVFSDGLGAGATLAGGSGTNSFPANKTAFSVDIWIKCLNSDNAGGVVVQGWDDVGSFDLEFDGTNWQIAYTPGGGSLLTLVIPTNLGDGNWHYVVTVWDSGTLTVYVDGVSAATSTGPDPAMAGEVYGVYTVGENGFYKGYFDEHAVYTTALSPTDVATLFAIGSGTSPAPSVKGGGFRCWGCV